MAEGLCTAETPGPPRRCRGGGRAIGAAGLFAPSCSSGGAPGAPVLDFVPVSTPPNMGSRRLSGRGSFPQENGGVDARARRKEYVIERLRPAEAQIRNLGVRRLALFGSVARGEARPDSDVDLLVEFTPGEKNFDRFLALSELLERLLECPVELITTEALSPFIGPHILAEAADVLRAA